MKATLRFLLPVIALLALLVPSSASACVRCAWFSFPLDGETFQDAFCIFGFEIGGNICVEGNLACATVFDCVAEYAEEEPDLPTAELASGMPRCPRSGLGTAVEPVSLVVRR